MLAYGGSNQYIMSWWLVGPTKFDDSCRSYLCRLQHVAAFLNREGKEVGQDETASRDGDDNF